MDDATLARFMSKIEVQPNGCWRWTGKPAKNGYGRFWIDGKTRYAHIVAYEHFVGPIPDGHEVDHVCHGRDTQCPGGVCDHRLCVNPEMEPEREHLEAVPQLENIMRSRGVAPKNAAKTECDKGHRFDSNNTYVNPSGERICRACQRENRKAWAEINRPASKPSASERTHCPQDHEYTNDNTYVSPQGKRHCRRCRSDKSHTKTKALHERALNRNAVSI